MLDEYHVIHENSAVLFFAGNDKRYYENTNVGRAQLFNDCSSLNRTDLYKKVLAVWGDTPTLPDPAQMTVDDFKARKKAAIAAARYEAEIAGTTVNGFLIDTGRDSQALITGAALAAVIDGEYSLNWKTEAGFIHLTAPEIIAVAQSVRAHVQSCFDREGELVALVDAAQTEEELDAIDISFE